MDGAMFGGASDQKAERVLKLLLGLRNLRVDESLRHYGFKDADLEEGWKRLKALSDDKLSTRGPAKQDPSLLAELDAWENVSASRTRVATRFGSLHLVAHGESI